jgi:hypothetical protein
LADQSPRLLSGGGIELLRYLHDHRTTRFALVLVGGNGTWRATSIGRIRETGTRPSL